MKEFKIIKDSLENCQRKLNQWKHEYNLEITSSMLAQDGDLVIILIRSKKNNEQ